MLLVKKSGFEVKKEKMSLPLVLSAPFNALEIVFH